MKKTDEGSSSSSDENTVQAHGIKWLFREGVVDDNFKDQRYKSVLRVGHPDGLTELDLFRHFFPGDEVAHILQCTNTKMPTRKKNVTKGDLFKVFGILYAMTTVEMPSRRSYWSTDGAGLFPAPACSLHRGFSTRTIVKSAGSTRNGLERSRAQAFHLWCFQVRAQQDGRQRHF